MASGGKGGGKGNGKKKAVTKLVFYGEKRRREREEEEEEEVDDLSYGGLGDISGDSDDSVRDPTYEVNIEQRDYESEQPVASGSGISDATGGGLRSCGVGGDGGDGGEPPRGRGRVRQRGSVEKKGRVLRKSKSHDDTVKEKRNLGKEYVSYRSVRKSTVQARRIRSPCKDGCYDKVPEAARNAIFTNFWNIGNYNDQNSYISQCINQVPVKRRYGQDMRMLRLNYSYTVKYQEESIQVCRTAFLHIHDISNTRLRLQANRLRMSETGTPPGDKRGRHGTEPKQKITGARLQRVHEHITSLPTTSSHYTRAKSPHRLYLDGCSSVKDLYSKYKCWMRDNEYQEELVKVGMYRKIFTQEYNIAFKPPKKDTCTTCDELNATITQKLENNEDVTALEERLELHKKVAKEGQELLKSQVDVKEIEGLSVRTVCMDLQQTLPCPRISTGLAYYLRKLWVYNFCIHDVHEGRASMFVWDETTGGRGSDEVASCILKWLSLRSDEGQEFDVLRIFCDNCAGQNKNMFVLLTALRMIHAKKLFRVEIIFLVSGHSFLPCDRDFGVLEKKFRVHTDLLTTNNYAEVIRDATTPPFEVVLMSRDEFLDVKTLAQYITKRKPDVAFSSARQLVVDAAYKEGYILKTNYLMTSDSPGQHKCRLMKSNKKYNAKLFDLSSVVLPEKYATERVLNTNKIKDLGTLQQFVGPSNSRRWLSELVERQRALEGPVSVADDEDVGTDDENDLEDYTPPRRRSML